MKEVVEASIAVAKAVKLCRVRLCPMYPITPSTHIPEKISEFIFSGEMDAEMIHVESEHSAASALIGGAAAGVRCFSATSSQGLALMFEILPILSGMRLPVVMAVANRALSAPLNIWNDHSDSVSVRDQGLVQLWVESSQEALDSTIQAYRIAEDREVLLPATVNLDGFSLSHVWEPVDVPELEAVDKFLPEFRPTDVLDPAKPKTFGPIVFPTEFMEFKKMQQDAMERAAEVIKKVNNDFKKQFGRAYGNGLMESYMTEDADYAVIAMGTICGTAHVTVDKMRKKGIKAGLIRIRSLRPFPEKELLSATKKLRGLSVIDRHISLGQGGPLYTEVKAALCGSGIKINSYIAGLGGRDVTLQHIERAFNDLVKGREGGWLL